MNDIVEFWEEHYIEKYQGSSPFLQLDNVEKLFVNKDVFEIGPGEGRQFKKVNRLCKSYTIADIVQKVLDEKIYNNIDNKYLISYTFKQDPLPIYRKFDTIHFWYVVHHILKSYLNNFFKFIKNHIKHDGSIIFNYQIAENMLEDKLYDDGKKTTNIKSYDLEKIINSKFNIINSIRYHKVRGSYVFKEVICKLK